MFSFYNALKTNSMYERKKKKSKRERDTQN